MGPGRLRLVVAAACLGAPLVAIVPALAPYADAGGTVGDRAFPGDNGRITFVSDRDGNRELYSMLPDGSQLTRLTSSAAQEGGPSWSPDGSRLLFERGTDTESDIYVMNRDGSGLTRLTDAAGADVDASWSPDGTRILFASDRDRADGRFQVWVMDADGTDEQVLVTRPANGTAVDPSWSPTGDRIAYAEGSNGGIAAAIVTAAPDGTGPTVVAAEADGADEPEWSPDGSRIVYVETSSSLVSITADGLDRVELNQATETGRLDEPSWSPDGTSIAYQRLDSCTGCRTDVWVMAADGSDPAPVAEDPDAADAQPSWQVVPVPTLVVTPTAAAREVGDEHAVTLRAVDGAGVALDGVRLHVDITGPHAQAGDRISGADGRASYIWSGTATGTDTLVACVDDDASGSCEPGETAATATVLWLPPTPVDHPRLAFTDDADALYEVGVARTQLGGGALEYSPSTLPASYGTQLQAWDAGPTHEGEAAGVPATRPVFVSTRDDPNGEVYQALVDGGAERVTCDPGTETHPVRSTTGAVAYASDADGDWDVYVSFPPPDPGPGRVAPFGRVPDGAVGAVGPLAQATACDATWTTVKVTDTPLGTDELWPTWTYRLTTGGGHEPSGLVFSRAESGALPDLYQAPLTGATTFGPATALTSTPEVAETQPAAMISVVDLGCAPSPCFPTYDGQGWVAFTTTQLSTYGTVAFLSPSAPGTVIHPAGPRFSATEPAWSSIDNPTSLSVTSTDRDPYGDIAIGSVTAPTDRPGLGTTGPPVVSDLQALVGPASGTSESHAFWLDDFGVVDLDDQATLVYTSRSTSDVRKDARFLQADVSDVLAVDGSQRRVIRRKRDLAGGEVVLRYDEAGPAYSPDGTRIAYSENVGSTPDRRRLMVSDADGNGAVPLLPAGQRLAVDTDLDPTWSPDWSRVAFVRIRGDQPPEVWFYDRDTGVATRIPGVTDEGDGADLSPSWAPDSRHLVVARSAFDNGTPVDAARRHEAQPWGSTPEIVVVDADQPAAPATSLDSCGDGCTVVGRSPSWSPDGTTIAYEYDGQIEVVGVPTPCCTGPVAAVDPPVAVTGFELGVETPTPTPSRSVVASAQDPAWSPDGTEIAFAGQPVGQPDKRGIWAIAPDGTGLRLVTDEPGPETEPAWEGTVPVPAPEADVRVTVTVAPSPVLVGAPMVATYVVKNLGPDPASDVALTTAFAPGALTKAPGQPPGCRFNGTGCDYPVLASGESRFYQVRIRHLSSILGFASGTVVAGEPVDPVLTNNVDADLYRVLSTDLKVRIKLDEPVGYVGGLRTAVVTVRNVGADPLLGVDVNVVRPAEVDPFVPPVVAMMPPPAPPCLVAGLVCFIGPLDPGAVRSYRIGLRMLAEGSVQLRAEATTTTPEIDLSNNVSTVDLEILQPEIRVLPSVSPPGRVVLAYGESMPPGSEVDLAWSLGLTVEPGPWRVRDDGTIRVPLLVVRHDLLGTRLLTATSTESLFSPVDGELLVVPRTLVPPNFTGRS